MFTVLIAEKEHIQAIQQENKLFFEPFLENKELTFCEWNPQGQDLHEAVPGLYDAIGRRREWRALILQNTAGPLLKKQNPFDTVDRSPLEALTPPPGQPDENEPWGDWEARWKQYFADLTEAKEQVYRNALELPLQKLGTWLCFRPEDYILNTVRERRDVHDWAMEQVSGSELKPSERLELLERAQYKTELQLKEQLRREFIGEKYLNICYPQEVNCISPRTSDNGFFDPEHYWNIRPESDYSAFADRNLYLDRMRFMVFDLLPQTHRSFRNDHIRFMASLLIFACNPLPASAMKARRLYRLEAETDDSPLCTLVTSYDRKLAATSEVIDNEMERIRSEIPGELTDKAAEELFCTPKDVAVVLDDSCEPDRVQAPKDYGFFFDQPEPEDKKWKSDYAASKKALGYIVKQQSRSVRKSVAQMHFTSEVNDVNVSRLTPFQIDDIRDYTENAENEMIEAIPPDMADLSQHTKQLEEASDAVKATIAQRMTKKTTAVLMALCLGLFVMCFLPFLFSNNHTAKTVTTAVIMIGVSLGVLIIILAVCLYFLRGRVINAVKAYNNTAHGVMNQIQASMKRFSRYLSASCNVRRGHSVLSYAQKNLDEYTLGLRIRKKHQEDIRKRRAYLAEEYGDYLAGREYCDASMVRPYELDFDRRTEYDYPAPFLAGDRRQIEFITSGNYVTVPSSFVTRLLVRMEGIYDR